MITKRFWQLSSIATLAFALVANFVVATQRVDVPSINALSDKYASLLTPADYAFGIWSVIYSLLILFVIYQARDILKPNKTNELPLKTGFWFAVASICNGIWTYIFVKEWIGLSVIVLLLLVASLYTLLGRLRIAVYDAPIKVIVCVWWPLMLYTGWVTVAAVVNIASWMTSHGVVLSPFLACWVLVGLMFGLLALLVSRNVRELLLASIWGIAAVGVRQTQLKGSAVVATTAFVVSGVLLVAVAIHAYKNRRANPFLPGQK
ncbi:MAG TPA: hypothetical protein VFI74_03540 [Candidatus Saccharimonadales bacterium]|nr:hypothetical protein [Candidatus Saccharimonadales bacterium]